MTIIIRIIGVLMCLMGCIGLWNVVPFFFRFSILIFDDQFGSVAIGMTIIYGLLFTIYGLMTAVSIGIVRLTPRSIRSAIPVLLVASFSDVLIALLIRIGMNKDPIFLCSNPKFQLNAYIYWIFLLTAACICLLSAAFLWVYYRKLSGQITQPTGNDGRR